MKKLHFLILILLCAWTAHAQMTDVQLGQAADTIQNETVRGANTATRIGRLFNNIIDNKVNVNTQYTNPTFVNSLPWSKITSPPTTLAGYGITDAAALASPALTGTPTAPTATTGTNTSQIATTAFVQQAMTNDVVSVTGTASLDATAFGKLHLLTGTSSNYTVTLPTASGNSGKSIAFKCSSALTKLVTIDGLSAETIDGDADKVIWAKEALVLFSNGTNWEVLEYKFRAMTAGLYIDSYSIPHNTSTKVLFNTQMHDNTGLMVDLANSQINILRKGTYRMVGAGYPLTTAAASITSCGININGVAVTGLNGSRGGNTSGRQDQLNAGTRPVELNAGDIATMGLFQNSGSSVNWWARMYVQEMQ